MAHSAGLYPRRVMARSRHARWLTRKAPRRVVLNNAVRVREHRLFDLARQVRTFLEPVWLEWHTAQGGEIPTPPSRSTCGRSSLFLKLVLEEQYPPVPQNAGNSGRRPASYLGFHAGSDWHSHAWVELDGWIIDITADQFGDEPILVIPAPDLRYQKGVNDHTFPEFIQERHPVVEALWSRWLAHRNRQGSWATPPGYRP